MFCLQDRLYGYTDGWGHHNIQASLINSLVLSGFVLNWFFVSWSQTLKKNPLAAIEFVCCVMILFLARSWWAWICIAVGFLFYYKTELKQWGTKHDTLWRLFGTSVFVFFVGTIFIKAHEHTGPYQGLNRFYYWTSALKMWKQNAWTGVGLGGFAYGLSLFSKSRDSIHIICP